MANEDPGRSSPYLLKLLLLIAGLVLVGILLWQFMNSGKPEPTTPMVQPEPEVMSAPPEPQPEQVPAEPAPAPAAEAQPEPLPELAESDAAALDAAEQLDGGLSDLLVRDNVIQKSVRAVIGAADGGVVHEYRPVRSPAGQFVVEPLKEEPSADGAQRYRLSPRNYERYQPYVDMLTSLKPHDVAAAYQRFYPLMEQAYAQHGVEAGSFKSVTLKAIDSLLAAPVLDDEPVLVRPRVYYEFEDQRLESLSATQKLLIRMGPDNTRKIQAALRELRSAIEAQNVP